MAQPVQLGLPALLDLPVLLAQLAQQDLLGLVQPERLEQRAQQAQLEQQDLLGLEQLGQLGLPEQPEQPVPLGLAQPVQLDPLVQLILELINLWHKNFQR